MSAADPNSNDGCDAPAVRSGTSTEAPGIRADQSLAVRCVNFGVFQAAWFSCVLGGARGWVWAAPAAAFLASATHLSLARSRRVEFRILLSVAAMGTVADMVLVAFGVVAMRHATFGVPATLAWFASLWIAFATTLNSSMSWLTRLQHRRALVASIFGAIGGPTAYLAGQRLGAITLPRDWSLALLALEWAILTPLAVSLAARPSAGRPAPGTRSVTSAINGQDPRVRR